MTGLVNAAGALRPARVQSALRVSQQPSESEREKDVPIVTSLQATERLVRSAVEALEFRESEQERGVPEGASSDRFGQADREAKPTGGLGQSLDLTA